MANASRPLSVKAMKTTALLPAGTAKFTTLVARLCTKANIIITTTIIIIASLGFFSFSSTTTTAIATAAAAATGGATTEERATTAPSAQPPSPPPEEPDFAVAGYLPEWRYEGANWNTLSQHLTHLIVFSAEPLPDGSLSGLDRLPRPELLAEARAAATRHGARLLVCFGGNGRSSGFPIMVSKAKSRARFIANVVKLLADQGYDGVDYNWEYPGHSFATGYDEKRLQADYNGLAALLQETRAALGSSATISVAYYPDRRQEDLLGQIAAHAPLAVNWFHAMAYDANGAHHSPDSLAERAVQQAVNGRLPTSRATLGLPFYGRLVGSGDWETYEDILGRTKGKAALLAEADGTDTVVGKDGRGGTVSFNSPATIERKVRLARKSGLGGVMIWEAGQDCRLEPVTHGDTTHARTCFDDTDSLLLAITRARTDTADDKNEVKKDEL